LILAAIKQQVNKPLLTYSFGSRGVTVFAVAGNNTFVLPNVDGTNGQVIKTDGSGADSAVNYDAAASLLFSGCYSV